MAKSAKRKVKDGAPREKTPAENTLSGFDAADLNALMMSLARLPGDTGDEALDLAQEKAFDAMEAPTAKKRAALAREALALSPRCADAYLILARETFDADEALDLYRQAVAAGAEAVGEAAFKNDVGLFWDLIQTRPYMRARHICARAMNWPWPCGKAEIATRRLAIIRTCFVSIPTTTRAYATC